MNHEFKPIIFRLNNQDDINSFNSLKSSNISLSIYDTLENQFEELYKVRHPNLPSIDKVGYELFVKNLLGTLSIQEYGAWVYYPWTNRIVHTLDESEFFEVRTNRNNNKIIPTEQAILKEKTIGIIGLSVGQSAALTIAMERVCGKLKLADFDTIELSNLNRIRTSIHNLGLPKVIAVAREIAEIDPFIEVEIFTDGLNDENIEVFFGKEKKLDVLIELCDSVDVKISSRLKAREYKIPVIMETNDRCMIDIERFDIDNNIGILHGLISENDLNNFSELTPQQKLQIILKIVDKDRLSSKMLEAFTLMGKTIRSWPQLASSVTMGAGITTDIARKILLGENCNSGRWYFDVEDLLTSNSVVFNS